MEIRGLGTGLGVFLVEMRVHYKTKDGFEGTESFPTMWTVGGTEDDAIENALRIIRPDTVPDMTGWVAYVNNADPDSVGDTVTRRWYNNVPGHVGGCRTHSITTSLS